MAHAHMVIGWYENPNMPSDSIPPRWMWHLDHELVSWFDRLSSSSNRGGGESVPMDKNEDPVVEHLRTKMGRR